MLRLVRTNGHREAKSVQFMESVVDTRKQVLERGWAVRVTPAKIGYFARQITTFIRQHLQQKRRGAVAEEWPSIGDTHLSAAAPVGEHLVDDLDEHGRAVDEGSVEIEDEIWATAHSGTLSASASSSRGRNGARSS